MSLKHITVSPENYLALKKLGDAGDRLQRRDKRDFERREGD